MPVKPKVRPRKAVMPHGSVAAIAGDGEVRACPSCGRDVRCYVLRGKIVVPQHDDPKTFESCKAVENEVPV